MHMVYMTFHSDDIYLPSAAFLADEFLKAILYSRDVEDLASIPWAEHYMVVYK